VIAAISSGRAEVPRIARASTTPNPLRTIGLAGRAPPRAPSLHATPGRGSQDFGDEERVSAGDPVQSVHIDITAGRELGYRGAAKPGQPNPLDPGIGARSPRITDSGWVRPISSSR